MNRDAANLEVHATAVGCCLCGGVVGFSAGRAVGLVAVPPRNYKPNRRCAFDPVNGSIERRVNQQPINRSTDQPINRSTDQPINRSTNINPFCYNHLRVFGRFCALGFLWWNASTNGCL
jgi:hypothetical protein